MSNDGGVISIMKSHVNVKKDKMKKTPILKKKAEDVEPELRPEFIEEVKKIEKILPHVQFPAASRESEPSITRIEK